MGIGLTSPTAYLHLKAGTASANTAPLKFTTGVLNTTPENGAVEFDGTHFYGSIGSTRYQLDQQTGTGGASSSSSTIVSSATPTPIGSSTFNHFTVTALAVGATFAVPSGTAVDGNSLVIRIKDNATARTLAWNAIYREVGVLLPTTTVISKTLYVKAIYNSADTKWDVVSITQEA